MCWYLYYLMTKAKVVPSLIAYYLDQKIADYP